MCYWKQWRYARTKVRELRKLGTSLYAAISVAISRKGPWHLARTLATQTGMTNQWLKDPCLQQAGRASVCQRAVGEHSLPEYGPVTSLLAAGKCEPPRAPACCRQGPACGVVWGLGD